MKTKLTTSSKILAFRVTSLLKHPMFRVLTLVGNSVMALSAYVFYLLEHPTNPKVRSYLDGLWWAVTTCTTVGDGDIIPSTLSGRILGITMMIFGTALFCSFTALFSSVLMGSKLDEVEEEIAGVDEKVKELKTEVAEDEIALGDLIQKLEATLTALNHRQKTRVKP